MSGEAVMWNQLDLSVHPLASERVEQGRFMRQYFDAKHARVGHIFTWMKRAVGLGVVLLLGTEFGLPIYPLAAIGAPVSAACLMCFVGVRMWINASVKVEKMEQKFPNFLTLVEEDRLIALVEKNSSVPSLVSAHVKNGFCTRAQAERIHALIEWENAQLALASIDIDAPHTNAARQVMGEEALTPAALGRNFVI